MSLIAELKRRNVFRVGVAYAIVAWLLIEVASVVLPALHLPDWTLTLLVFLVVSGGAWKSPGPIARRGLAGTTSTSWLRSSDTRRTSG